MEQHKISRKNVTYLRKKKETQNTLRKDLSIQMLLEEKITASFFVQNQYFELLFFGKLNKTQPRKGPYTM